jgi:hypothetical protein
MRTRSVKITSVGTIIVPFHIRWNVLRWLKLLDFEHNFWTLPAEQKSMTVRIIGLRSNIEEKETEASWKTVHIGLNDITAQKAEVVVPLRGVVVI